MKFIAALLTALITTQAEAASLKLIWTYTVNPYSKPCGFTLERHSQLEAGWTYVGRMDPSAREYVDNGLTAGVMYYYKINAYNALGTSTFLEAKEGAIATRPDEPAP